MTETRSFYDCRPQGGRFKELLLLTTPEMLKVVKGLRSPDYQACCEIHIPQLPQTDEEFLSSDARMLMQVTRRLAGELWYDRVIIVRRDASDDVSGIISAVKEYCPELLAQGRLFLTELRAPLDESEFHRAIGEAQPIATE